jgi:predicted dehydrogenase
MKVAVIGRGFGANVMAPAYKSLGFDVDIVPSRDPDAVVEACAEPVDLVSIHSPPFQHHEHVMAALAAGRNVLCDKPFGRNAAEARAMCDAAKEAGVLHFLNFEFRCGPVWRKAKQLIDEGAIGELTHVDLTSFGSGLRGRPHGWLSEIDSAGGWIGAFGSHVIDGLRFFFGGEVADCGGMARTEIPFRPDKDGKEVRSTAEDAFSCWFAMADGGTARVDSAYAGAVDLPLSMQLLGSEGAISISGDVLIVLRPGAPAETIDLSPKPGEPGFPAVPLWLAKVKEALQHGRQITPSFDDGVAVAKVMDRLKAAVVRPAVG